jgi:NAD(P)H-hydrate epimerase
LTRAELRELDRLAIERYGVPGVVLMENAGRGAAETLLARFAERERRLPRSVAIVCGPGNNGGDGYVVARHLALAGVDVRIASLVAADALSGDARTMRTVCERLGLAVPTLAEPTSEWLAQRDEVWVDAILGTGFEGALRGGALAWVRALASTPARLRVALDLPSGLDADRGVPCPVAPCVDLTATFAARKVGFDSPAARPFLGEVVVVSIGVPASLAERACEKERRPGT